MSTTDDTDQLDELETYLAAPEGLSESARELWDRTLAVFEDDDSIPDPAEHRLLVEACRTATLVDQLAEEITATGLTVAGPAGRTVPNPLLATIDTARRTLATLLKTLRETTRAESSRANGASRWRR